MVLKLPPAPRFDPASTENRFAWIIRAAQQHRAARNAAMGHHRTLEYLQRVADSRPIKP